MDQSVRERQLVFFGKLHDMSRLDLMMQIVRVPGIASSR